MGTTEGDGVPSEARPSEDRDRAPSQDKLRLRLPSKQKMKSPTPGTLRDRSATPVRGRSSTPFSLYVTRRSETPSAYRSITPFINREEKEKTPFELGHDIKTQLICNLAVLDKAAIMDISESLDAQDPVRYITSDRSVIDRAAVMDVSNVEVIYVVEEYEDETAPPPPPPVEVVEDVKEKRKSSRVRRSKAEVSSILLPVTEKTKADSTTEADKVEQLETSVVARDESVDAAEAKPVRRRKWHWVWKKKIVWRKKKKMTLKLEMGAGKKGTQQMFEKAARPAPKKSKMVMEMEARAQAAKKEAEEAERIKREREEKKERERREAEERARREEEEAAAEAAALAAAEAEEEEWGDEYGDEYGGEYGEEEEEGVEEHDDSRRESEVYEDFVRPDPDDEEHWTQIAKHEGEELSHTMREFYIALRTEKETERAKEREDWLKFLEKLRFPRLICPLTDRTVQAGENVRLVCAVDGPDLKVKWYKNNIRIERDSFHRITKNNSILSMEILNSTSVESGKYKVVVSNLNDEISSTCNVTVNDRFKDAPKPPEFRQIREYYHMRNDQLTIECTLYGIPRPRVTWWFGKYEIIPNFKYSIVEEAHGIFKLNIFKPNYKDTGTYTCKAINISGAAETSHSVEIAKNPNPHPVKGNVQARDHVQEDEEDEAGEIVDEEVPTKAELETRRALAREARQRITADALAPLKEKLQFATHLHDSMAMNGATVKFVCTVVGPGPVFRWMKDGNYITYGGNVKNLSADHKGILEVSKVTPESSGIYKCIARNEHSEIETSCVFKVYSAQPEGDEREPPIFSLPLRDNYSLHENDLVLDCRVRGKPRPTIQWMKGMEPIEPSPRYRQVDHPDGYSKLVINNPTEEDSGVYTCVAANDSGKNKITHIVDFSGRERFTLEKTHGFFHRDINKPHFIAQLGNQTVSAGGTIAISAEFMATDAPIDVHWYRDRQLLNGRPNIRTFMDRGVFTMAIMDATPEDEGTYTCRASTQYGHTESHATVDVIDVTVDPPPNERPPLFLSRPPTEMKVVFKDPFSISFRVSGEPKPKLTFMKGTRDITKSDRVIKEVSDDYIRFTVQRSQIADCGTYFVVARNPYGTDRIFVSVTIKTHKKKEES